MKIFYILAAVFLTLSLCGCKRTATNDTMKEPTTIPETQPQTTAPVPTIPPIEPNVPGVTEGRGSTDDTTDNKNETLPEEMERIRRRIMD